MIAQDICEYLNSVRPDLFSLSENLFIGNLLDIPDNQVVIIPTGGFQQLLRTDDVRYTFQIRIRDKVYALCYNKAVTIYNILDDGNNREIIAPSGRKMIINALQPPFFLGRDGQNRTNFAFNIAVLTKRE